MALVPLQLGAAAAATTRPTAPPGGCRGASRAARPLADEFGVYLLVTYFLTYVASNASTTFEPSGSTDKHGVMIVMAIASLVRSPKQALWSLLLFTPLLATYFVGDLPAYALMATVFALALPLVAASLHLIIAQRRRGIVMVLLAIALLPALYSLSQGRFDLLWSDQYGRERLLLGYWHPKEAAATFTLPLLLHVLTTKDKAVRYVLWLAPALLWVIGSRNVALTVYLLFGLWRAPRTTWTILGVSALAAAALVAMPDDSLEALDHLSSLRLSVWGEALKESSGAGGDDLVFGNRLAIDSFYVEVLASAGLTGLAAVLAWATYLVWRVGGRRIMVPWAMPALIAVLFFATFDSGVVSTGNLMHIALWGLGALPLFARGPARRRATARALIQG